MLRLCQIESNAANVAYARNISGDVKHSQKGFITVCCGIIYEVASCLTQAAVRCMQHFCKSCDSVWSISGVKKVTSSP